MWTPINRDCVCVSLVVPKQEVEETENLDSEPKEGCTPTDDGQACNDDPNLLHRSPKGMSH